ncbi:YbjN domain-containing protein [Oscillatoria sp. FACHB-1406]|uniref:YbjN domain-containing protein n=1 Tax=Oscillatoria sp. FACHB-1406 TaxID=2692846 RepID=UPI0016833F0B|nr:YbjN domain-containing protein [Oscillatoria sp. FACHB-1406]MBD2576488.1 YbjN domain-containing protein [Oscillatoria sp. FACHB-1406]
MTTKTENYQLGSELTLLDRTQSPLPIHAVTLALTKQDDELIECRLTFQVNPELYQRIDTEALFNLKQEVRNPLSSGGFLPEPDIKIETTLKPDLLPRLAGHTANIDEAVTYILNLSQEQPDDPLLFTENWLALSVKQLQESGETGYRTLWDYISPTALARAATSDSNEEISEAIVHFFRDWTEANLSEVTQKATSQMLEGMTNLFNELTDVNLDKKVEEFKQNLFTSGRILEEIVGFFTKDDWHYTKIQGEAVLLTAFQGESGKWNCSARVREEQEQFVFYSICPVNAPEDRRLDMAEFIARANYGTIIGNFELDFNDGEIRYKTSIDVEDSTLTFSQIKQLVYTNVMMMDEYLPGIRSVIEGEVEAKEAIARIEGRELEN